MPGGYPGMPGTTGRGRQGTAGRGRGQMPGGMPGAMGGAGRMGGALAGSQDTEKPVTVKSITTTTLMGIR